jgi:hypothetical protein
MVWKPFNLLLCFMTKEQSTLLEIYGVYSPLVVLLLLAKYYYSI